MKTNLERSAGPQPGYGPLPTARVSRSRAHRSTARAGILHVLVEQPAPRTPRALSALTRQHPNTIREHLEGLVHDRLSVRTPASEQARGRPAWLYCAAPEAGSDPGARECAGLACALAAQIAATSTQPHAGSIEAGRIWGRELIRLSSVTTAEPAAPGRGPVPGAAMPPSAVATRRTLVTLMEKLGFAASPAPTSSCFMGK